VDAHTTAGQETGATLVESQNYAVTVLAACQGLPSIRLNLTQILLMPRRSIYSGFLS